MNITGNWKTSFIYENGLNIASQPMVHGSIQMLSMLRSIDLALFHFPVKYKINGIIFISYENKVLSIDFDIRPLEAREVLKDAIIQKHTTLRDEGRLKFSDII